MNGDLMTDQELTRLLRDLRKYQVMLDETKAEIQLRYQMIQDHMATLGVQEMTHSGYKITWKPISFISISGKDLQRAYPQIYEEIGKPVQTMRFKITASPIDAKH